MVVISGCADLDLDGILQTASLTLGPEGPFVVTTHAGAAQGMSLFWADVRDAFGTLVNQAEDYILERAGVRR